MLSPMPSAGEELPPLRDDVLYDAETAGRYIGRNREWIIRAARADTIPSSGKIGRFWVWNAATIRQIISGEPHTPKRRMRKSRMR
jgi:hypothetical protein